MYLFRTSVRKVFTVQKKEQAELATLNVYVSLMQRSRSEASSGNMVKI